MSTTIVFYLPVGHLESDKTATLLNLEPRRATTKESCWTSLHGIMKKLEEGIIFNKLEAFHGRQKWAFCFGKICIGVKCEKGPKMTHFRLN